MDKDKTPMDHNCIISFLNQDLFSPQRVQNRKLLVYFRKKKLLKEIFSGLKFTLITYASWILRGISGFNNFQSTLKDLK